MFPEMALTFLRSLEEVTAATSRRGSGWSLSRRTQIPGELVEHPVDELVAVIGAERLRQLHRFVENHSCRDIFPVLELVGGDAPDFAGDVRAREAGWGGQGEEPAGQGEELAGLYCASIFFFLSA